MKINIELVLGISYTAFMVGMSAGRVGEMPKDPSAPFEWWLPILMLVVLGTPFVLGFFAGRNTRCDGDSQR